MISRHWYGVFRLCGGDGGSSPLDPRKPSGGGLDPPLFNSRHGFCLAFHFVPLRLFFLAAEKNPKKILQLFPQYVIIYKYSIYFLYTPPKNNFITERIF